MPRKFNPEGMNPPPFYSHGVEVEAGSRMVFVSGQVGVKPDGTLAEGVAEQTKAAMENLAAVLAAAGLAPSDIVKSTIYLTDEADFDGFTQAAFPYLTMPPGAATLLYVKALASPAMRVEIEAVAAK